ncbi:IucA/IucC family protein [Saccharopolyspora spinosa]|uniref:Siderophore synthetase component n=1 Tax=Saccharopolyspora spinosa TaxID=60894 RepID=A0A2N3Y5H2_SACSN|nr:IucA/IucC family protein [Saccharopolyspora spinosa]PKW18192.1 siderophore synthetase component [Saccharopolyspora spinosa]
MTAELVHAALTAPSFQNVRRRVFRQLVESLVYEGALKTRQDGDEHFVDGADAAGAGVCYSFRAVRRFGFDRVGLTSVVRRGDVEAESVALFLAEVRDSLDADAEHLTGFARELAETLFKDALSEHVRTERRTALSTADYDTLESAITDGHRYHPTYKSRLGFDAADNIAFGPEFANPVRPLWLAAHRRITEISASASVDDQYVAGQLGPAAVEFHRRIAELGHDPGDYVLVPVHPWQWRERIARAFSDQLGQGELIPLGTDPDDFGAQQSIRTLACWDDPQRPYLKLSMSIVNTSTSRGLAAHTVRNAARITDWLRQVVAGDDYLRDELRPVLLGEDLGVAVTPESGLLQADTYGALACIWRESLHRHLEPGERAVPFTGLTACHVDGTPLIDPWVRELGVEEWVRRLVRVSVLPLVHLLCRHGIALESHAQNMVLVHENGTPTRVVLKDFHDGVRFSRAHLAEPQRCPELAGTPAHHQNRNSFVETGELGLVTDFLLDAFFFINLGELAIFLADRCDLDERRFWRLVRDEIRAYQQRFGELADRFALFDVFTPTIEVEKLTTRRLLPDTELRLHTVPNPLAEVDRC